MEIYFWLIILKKSFHDSPMFNGRIQGLGPRYCPSIEDKIERFSSKDRHQLFIEPEGKKTIEIYLNGFSTSLPEKTQIEALRKIEGLENVKMFRAGYAIEYDYFPPTQLKHTLEIGKTIKSMGPIYWNELREDERNAKNINTFKRLIKSRMIEK